MRSPWAPETGQEAAGAGSQDRRVRAHVCTCVPVCLRVRCHPLSIPLDKPEPGCLSPECLLGCPGLCLVGPAAPSGNMGRRRRAERRLRGGSGAEMWAETPSGVFGNTCARGPDPSLPWFVARSHTARGTAKHSSCVCSPGPLGVWFPCSVRASSLLDPPCPHLLKSTVAPWPR